MVEAIFWDVDNTLIDNGHVLRSAKRAAVSAMHDAGLPIESVEDGLLRFQRLEDYFNVTWHASLLRLLCIECGIEDKRLMGRLIKVGDRAFRDQQASVSPLPGVEFTLDELRKRRLRQGIISNALACIQMEKLRTANLLQFFDPELILISSNVLASSLSTLGGSDEFGGLKYYIDGSSVYRVEKPWVTMFEEALERTQCCPSELIFVGDQLIDVIGAKVAGIVTVLLRRHSDTGRPDKGLAPLLTLEIPDYCIGNPVEILGITDGERSG